MKKKHSFRLSSSWCWVAGALLLAATMPVGAVDDTTSDRWQYGAQFYLWGASIGGKTASGSEVDVKFDDIFNNLKLAFMGAFEARKGKWKLFADVIYLNVEDDGQVAPGVNANVKLSSWVVTPAVQYNLVDQEKLRFEVHAGARYLYLKPELKVGPVSVEDSGSVWDGIVGVEGYVNLGKNWYVPYYLDVGTGESNLTWQALGGIGYRFSKVNVLAQYRYLEWDFDDDALIDDLNIQGPFVGFEFLF